MEHKELYSVLCGDQNGKEIQKRGVVCICIADSLCCTVEANTLQSNYTPIKNFLKKKLAHRILGLAI